MRLTSLHALTSLPLIFPTHYLPLDWAAIDNHISKEMPYLRQQQVSERRSLYTEVASLALTTSPLSVGNIEHS